MAINIKFDLVGNPEPPTIILANRNGNKLGQLKANTNSIELADKLNDASEVSFTINKYIDDKLTPLWDKVVDFKLIYCKEWDAWFEIKVELDEETETVKTVFCTQLGQAELSQIMLYDIEINTEKDIERDDYKISILYDSDHPDASILHRLLKDKAPHYSIAYVSPTIAKIQRSFSFDNNSILNAFQEIAEEIGCLFQFYARIEDGVLRRYIEVYDLQQYCNDCGHRGEYTDKCPKCSSTNITNGYGDDTLIFVTSDELAAGGIQLVTDTDSVKNCFKLEAGDDLMTATVSNCNPNGSNYIWYFSDAVKEDMTDELVEKIESYDELYRYQYNDGVSNVDAKMLESYNALVDKYSAYNDDLQKIITPITGYSNLMNAYYNTIDLSLYLKSVLMPSIKMSETNAKEQASLLTTSSLSPVAIADVNTVSLATANSAVLAMAKIVVKSTFKVEIKSSTLYDSGNKKYWNGKFVITNYSDDEDTAESNEISVELNDDLETVTKQKIEKALNKENTDDLSITGLFEKEYNDFCAELKKYALNPLVSFRDACQVCIDILIDQGVGDKNTWSDNATGSEGNLYEKLYLPYYNKLKAIEAEIKIREDEVNIILGTHDNEGNLISDGLQTNIENCIKQIQTTLDFNRYLGDKLWLEFCSYRREDTYSNDNYISDGLNNAELFKKAQEFFEVAENEIYKSAELQRSISTTLNNLLAIDKFKPLVNSFKNGNWIRVQIDDQIYKLRLLEYSISFSDFDNITVEFSDVTKIKNGITDIESILSQASSMATSYDSVKRQSTQGNQANGTINQWLESGLNSALVRIQSNDSEDITLTKNGLLCRSYDDITETYSPEQFRLTHNIMAYTTDNWKTVATALGKHGYVYWDGTKFVNAEDYGLSTKFVTAGYINGSQIIGGEIVSSNYESGKKGTYFNLIDGDFELAGGKFTYNDKSSQLSIKNVSIDWSSTTNPDIDYVVGLADSLNGLSTRITANTNSITSEVARATEAEGNLGSRITQTADSITSEVARATQAEGQLSSKITQTAGEIRSEVNDSNNALSSRITQNASSITAEVTRATQAENSLDSRLDAAELKITPTAIVGTVRSSTEYQNDLAALKISDSEIVAAVTSSQSYKNLSSDISNLDSRLDAAELKITSDAIVSTVTSSQSYKNDLGSKANQSDVNSLSTKVSTIEQTSNNITLRVQNLEGATPSELSNSSISIDTNGVDMSGGNINIHSGVKFLVESGGTVQIAAGDGVGSYINFGEAFSASKNGVTAVNGNFTYLSVNGKSVLTEDSLGSKIVVSATEPSERGIIWIQPSLVTQVSYKAPTGGARDGTLYISDTTRTFTAVCDSSDTLPNGNYKYTIRFPIILVYETSWNSDVTISVSAYKASNQNLKITFPDYHIDYMTGWQIINVELSVESSTNLCADSGNIIVSIGARGSQGNLYVDRDSNVALSVASRDVTGGVQACSVFYKT